MANLLELKVPDIGGSTDVNVAEVYMKVGDSVKKDDNLLMLETDKATMEVPAETSGIIKEVLIKVGDKVSEGSLIARIEVEGEVSKPQNAEVKKPDVVIEQESTPKVSESKDIEKPKQMDVVGNNEQREKLQNEEIDESNFKSAYASPSIRKLAREIGVDLTKIHGSGDKGRITDEDLKSFAKNIIANSNNISGSVGLNLPPLPKVDFSKFGEIEVKELSRIKKLSGANLARNWVMIPHVTQFDEADITELENFRKQLNEEYKKSEIKITPLAFLIKASIFALKKFPEFNTSIEKEQLIYKKYFNIGFAADTPNGLVVPVLKDADKKGIVEIAEETASLAKIARDGKLKPTDMQGGTFTISSLGGIGGTAFTPIINAPEVAILGISKSSIKPIYNGKEFIPRLMLPLSLSYDHRIIDGALAAKFTSYLAQVLSDIRRLSL